LFCFEKPPGLPSSAAAVYSAAAATPPRRGLLVLLLAAAAAACVLLLCAALYTAAPAAECCCRRCARPPRSPLGTSTVVLAKLSAHWQNFSCGSCGSCKHVPRRALVTFSSCCFSLQHSVAKMPSLFVDVDDEPLPRG